MDLFQYLFYFKAIHIIGAVAWFSGLFYLVRMFVYHREAMDKSETEKNVLVPQLIIMENRVYKAICNPAMMVTWTFGILMLVANPAYLSQGWLHTKLLFVVLLTAYQLYCKARMKKLAEGDRSWESFGYRLLNEVPTLFLVGIVFLAVLKTGINQLYLLGGILAFGLFIFWVAKRYKARREREEAAH